MLLESSDANEVIRAVLNSLLFFFFLQKDFARTKSKGMGGLEPIC